MIVQKQLHTEITDNYLKYALETLKNRAIVDIRDGLKPVHLRILYSMYNLGITNNSKTVKSARVVGDVIGKYHPHGDTAVYESMVRLSQPWNTRYPCVLIEGNKGSIDGDSAAAQRYTETKLTKYGEEMMHNINKNLVEHVNNYDDTLKEPLYLPSLLPNYLANGTEGIACGFASSIPSHNITEIYNACIFILDTLLDESIDNKEEYVLNKLHEYILGPDLPGGGVIVNNNDWLKIIKTGRGKITVKAKYEIIDNKNEKQMVITELPYQVKKLTLVNKIDNMIFNNTIEGIKEIKDLSSNGKIKIVISFKKNANHELIINNLLAKTDLRKNISYNMVGLKDKELDSEMNILYALDEFLGHALTIIKKEAQYDIDKKQTRLNLIEAMIKVLESDESIEQAIKIIRYDKENKLNNLMSTFDLSKEQAEYVLTRQLGQLGQENYDNYINESNILQNEIPHLEDIINNNDNIAFNELKARLLELKDRFGDERRTAIIPEHEVTNEDLIKDEDITVIITSEGNIKSVLSSEYNIQKRNGKGSKATDMKDNEIITQLFTLKSKDDILFITNLGRIHILKAYVLPKVSKATRGKNIVNYISLKEDEYVVKTIATRIASKKNTHSLMFATANGTVKKLSLSVFASNLFTAIKFKDNDYLIDAELVEESDDIMIATYKGNCVRYNESSFRASGKTAIGSIGIKLKNDDKVIGISKINKNDLILSVTENGLAKKTKEDEFKVYKNRGGTGIRCHKISDKTGNLISVISVIDQDLLVVTKLGKIIRIDPSTISINRRDTSGLRLIKLDENDLVKTISFVPKKESDNNDN